MDAITTGRTASDRALHESLCKDLKKIMEARPRGPPVSIAKLETRSAEPRRRPRPARLPRGVEIAPRRTRSCTTSARLTGAAALVRFPIAFLSAILFQHGPARRRTFGGRRGPRDADGPRRRKELARQGLRPSSSGRVCGVVRLEDVVTRAAQNPTTDTGNKLHPAAGSGVKQRRL